jgi:hypothetical protein
MSWLLWRQHRAQALVATVALALFALVVWVTGVHLAHTYADAVRNCPANGACDLIGNLFRGDGAIVDLVHLSVAVPILLGVFLGVTLVARETEHATNVLVWTQTVTRRQWMLSKVAMAVAATVVWSAAVAALVTWWSGTPNALYGNRFEGTQFDTQNLLAVAFALFAVALGIAAGSLLRRTLPALAATIGIYVGVRLAVAVYLRPHYTTAIRRTIGFAADAQLAPGSWTISNDLVDPAGHLVTGRVGIPDACASAANRPAVQACFDRLGFHNVVSYHPASQYWRYQWTETALFLALAAALVLVGVVRTLRRDA